MSRETYEWLANNVLAGFQGKQYNRPVWWHDLARNQGHEPQTWDGAVPFDDVHKLLASWEPSISALYDQDMKQVTSHKLVRTPDGQAVIGSEHVLHLYGDWLTGTVREVVGDEVQISSSGLLANRMQAWVTVERPESAKGAGGVEFSPFITLSTSLDGSMASQINQNTQLAICDNTLSLARNQGLSFKHTSKSGGKLGLYRSVLQSIMQGETDFRKVLDDLLAQEVTDDNFAKILDALVPISEQDKPAKRTRSDRKRQEITTLYRRDPRVTQWTGTAFGVVQAVNTWNQHMSQLRNASGIEMTDTDLRAMRNYSDRLRYTKGESEDERTVSIVKSVVDSGHKKVFATV